MNIASKSEHERRLQVGAALLLNMPNNQRLRMLMILREGEATIKSMAHKLELSESALSQHLAKLQKGKLVEIRGGEVRPITRAIRPPHSDFWTS
jgi:DNA-binding transcriptional ArsR family regulator